jgi:chromosome partition protein MukF
MHESTDLHRVLGALHQSRAVLALDTAHLCYLIALRVRSEQANLASLGEDELVDLYMQVSELVDSDTVNPRLRATRAIQLLRDQRLLRRVDGAGVVRAGEYTLTRLAIAVVDFFIDDETLTRESLVVLTQALISQLGAILADARKATTEEEWQSSVIAPLSVTISDLVSGIERRQRGMDAQQEEVRELIEALLEQDWFAAVHDCEQLLEDTSKTLNELDEILLRDTPHLQAVLQDIEQLASEAGAADAEAQAQKVQEHLDRVEAWSGDRLRAWSDYYQFVQRYLRGVVRLDPDRAVSQRLRDQLAGWLEMPFALLRAFEPSIRLLREEETQINRPPLTSSHADREYVPGIVAPDTAPLFLVERVEEALAGGCDTLIGVVETVLPHLPPPSRYRAVGHIAELVAKCSGVRNSRERTWIDLEHLDLCMEDWSLPCTEETS